MIIPALNGGCGSQGGGDGLLDEELSEAEALALRFEVGISGDLASGTSVAANANLNLRYELGLECFRRAARKCVAQDLSPEQA